MHLISVSYADLQKYLNVASQISPKKHELDIITYTKVILRKDTLHLESSHLSYAVISDIQAMNSDLAEEASFLIKTDVFYDCIASFSADIVDLSVDLSTQQLTVKAKLSKAKLRINIDLLSEWRQFKLPDGQAEMAQTQVLGSDLAKSNRLSLIAVGQPKVVIQPEFLNVCYTV